MTDGPVADRGDGDRVGWFRFYVGDDHHEDRWEWSPAVQLMHGYSPGTVQPTTELVLSHKHPDDRAQVAAVLAETRRTVSAFSTRHRIVDARGVTRQVVVVGDQLRDEDGEVVGSHGFYVDVTPTASTARTVGNAATDITESRAGIERAKGMLMLVYRVDAETAFELLRWRSQETNVKLRVLAEQIVRDFLETAAEQHFPGRGHYDRVLLSAHTRAGG